MKINKSNLLSAVAAIAIMLAGTCGHAAGFQQGVAADQSGKPLVIGIWYPSQTIAKSVSMGPTTNRRRLPVGRARTPVCKRGYAQARLKEPEINHLLPPERLRAKRNAMAI